MPVVESPSSTTLLALRAGSANTMPVPAAAAADRVTVSESRTDTIVVPAAMWPPTPVSSIALPTSPELNVAVTEVKVVEPMPTPSRKNANAARRLGRWNVSPLPAGTAFDSLSGLPLLTARITLPAGMVGPVIGRPRAPQGKGAGAPRDLLLPRLGPPAKSA